MLIKNEILIIFIKSYYFRSEKKNSNGGKEQKTLVLIYNELSVKKYILSHLYFSILV